MLVCGSPHGGACCVGLWAPSWLGVLYWCVVALIVGRAVLVPVCGSAGVWCGGVWLGLSAFVGLRLRLCCLPGRGWCCAGAPPPYPVGACCVCACPPHGGVCFVRFCPPAWWGVVCWCLAPLLVGRAVSVPVCRGGGVSCRGVWLGLPSSMGVRLRLCCLPGRGWCCAAACPIPPPVGACCVCAWPPPWGGVLCRCVRVLVRGVLAGSMLGLFCWFAVVSAAVRPALSGVGCLCCLPGWVARAGLRSAGGAPPRVSVPRVPSPCCSFPLARPPLSCVCAAPGRALVFVRACCYAPPTRPLCLLSSAPPLCLLMFPRPPAVVVPPPPGSLRFAAIGVLLRIFLCSR